MNAYNPKAITRMLLLATMLAGLAACTTVTHYQFDVTDANGEKITGNYTKSEQVYQTYGGIFFPAYDSVTSTDIDRGEIVARGLPFGANVNIAGDLDPSSDGGKKTIDALTNLCEFSTAQSNACSAIPACVLTKKSDLSSADFAQAMSTCKAQCSSAFNSAQCAENAKHTSYSTTCPSACDNNRYPQLAMGASTYGQPKLACQCPGNNEKPPSCTDAAGLNEKTTDGKLVWSTCMPVELKPIQTNNPNDPLLKQMMSPGGSCTRVYNIATHMYDCI